MSNSPSTLPATPRVKNSLNAGHYPKNYEANFGHSLTVPDQSMSIREIMERYTNGLPITLPAPPPFNPRDFNEEPELVPEWKSLDLTEQKQFIADNQQRIRDLNQKLQDEQATKVDTDPLDTDRK